MNKFKYSVKLCLDLVNNGYTHICLGFMLFTIPWASSSGSKYHELIYYRCITYIYFNYNNVVSPECWTPQSSHKDPFFSIILYLVSKLICEIVNTE